LGFDHGVGHPLLLLCDTKAPNYRKKKAFEDLDYYSEWPKVADAVIKADLKDCTKTALGSLRASSNLAVEASGAR